MLEKVCEEMRNYSHFKDEATGKMVYRRYQKRPGETGPLKLKNFGWSIDTQDSMRLACDAILAQIEDDVVNFYHTKKDLEAKAKKRFCPSALAAFGGYIVCV